MTKSRESLANLELDDASLLRRLVEGTASDTGASFFRSLVDNVRTALGTMGAWVARVDDEKPALHAVSMRMKDNWLDGYTYEVQGTPCETALSERRLVHIPDRLAERYRGDPSLQQYKAVSYLGVPLFDANSKIIGQLAVIHDKPMPREPRALAIFQVFANRASAELSRMTADQAVLDREAQLRSLLDGVLDAIIDFDEDYRVALMNPAAQRVFGRSPSETALDVRELFGEDSQRRLERCVSELARQDAQRRSQWVAGGLGALLPDGRAFQTEATLSCYQRGEQRRRTLIMRDAEERLRAEQRIVNLTRETQQLRDELAGLQQHSRIVGSSAPLLRALSEVEQVAPTDATVLLLGETGTGKELFARAVHDNSKRRDKPLVRVNCGAIPHALIESELFGHEKGAFTGATQRREGRFALAHGGTIFLDEIGELPIELQPKLLRVIQEGELELVGSSRTVSVDVRIVAATHRDLAECVQKGTFREDLYYRLSVFPIKIPPLRERAGDIDELARVFLERHARALGKSITPLGEAALQRLRAYNWPGNVRELQNVIERGVIVSRDGTFDIDRALPGAPTRSVRAKSEPEDRVRTVDELAALERANIERALEQAGGKVSGEKGAAALLGTHPSTLSSRIRALGIKRP